MIRSCSARRTDVQHIAPALQNFLWRTAHKVAGDLLFIFFFFRLSVWPKRKSFGLVDRFNVLRFKFRQSTAFCCLFFSFFLSFCLSFSPKDYEGEKITSQHIRVLSLLLLLTFPPFGAALRPDRCCAVTEKEGCSASVFSILWIDALYYVYK